MINFLKNAPQGLKTFRELFDYAVNLYKQRMGVFPEGIDKITIQRQAANLAEERQKIVKFPEGGKDKVDPFKPRLGEFGITVLDDAGKPTKFSGRETPEGIMDFLMKSGKSADTTIGKAPKTTKKKPAVDPELQKAEDQKQLFMDFEDRIETEAEMLARMKKQNKEAVERLKKKKEKDLGDKLKDLPDDIDPDAMADGGRALMFKGGISKLIQKFKSKVKDKKAGDKIYGVGGKEIDVADFKKSLGLDKATDKKGMEDLEKKLQMIIGKDRTKHDMGGRIGFSGGGAGFAGDPMQGDKYVMSKNIPGSPQIPMGQFGPVNVGIFGGGGFSKNEIVPGVDMATIDQNYGIMGQIPIGNTGITLGADYMKSRANERFTGPRIPGQVFKSVPVDSDRFNIGINFRKQFKDGSKPKNPGRRNFLKLMGGLASLPFVGKLFKPVAKVAEAGGPAIAEGVKLGFDKFMMLVDKIKRLGRSTDELATQERQKVTRYEGKDGSEYELVEDLTTGDISITKDKPGVAVYGRGTDDVEGIDVIEDRSTFVLKRGQADETTKGKKPPDEYDEAKLEAYDGETFDAVDDVDDKVVNEILEELGETRTKKASGGLAYMLGE